MLKNGIELRKGEIGTTEYCPYCGGCRDLTFPNENGIIRCQECARDFLHNNESTAELANEDKSNIEFAINAYLITRHVDCAIYPTLNRKIELDMFEKLLDKVKRL